jgi:hypothetical protein
MGFFSWHTQDTDESIANAFQQLEDVFTVYMSDNKGNVWKETNYEGYGKFGGKDYHELLAEMNNKGTDRDAGIMLDCSEEDSPDILWPNLTREPLAPEKAARMTKLRPKTCLQQGYFYE